MTTTRGAGVLLAVCTIALGTVGVANALIPAQWKNCTNVNKRYAHGVGRVGAHDSTTGVPVTNFKRSNALYATAVKFNKGLDRDKDRVACEKK
jgi:hypothetical protein